MRKVTLPRSTVCFSSGATGMRTALPMSILLLAGCHGSLIDSAQPSGSGSIGLAGGVVRDGAATLTIPPGALTRPTSIVMSSVATPVPVPSGVVLQGAVRSLTPHGLPFTTPATLRLPISSGSVACQVLWLSGPGDTTWKLASGVALEGGMATLPLEHLSFYALVERTGGCALDNGGCDSNATCAVNAGVASCACAGGYEGDGFSCATTASVSAAFCRQAGANCGTLPRTDVSGALHEADCGSCAAPESCGAVTPNVCGCVAESDTEFCGAGQAQCGSLTANDNCGQERTVDCGGCAAGEVCSGTSPRVCACAPDSDTQLCAQAGYQCGPLTVTDNCGHEEQVDCGMCPAQSHCVGDAGAPSTCVCTPQSDAQLCAILGASCGRPPAEVLDNCGMPRTPDCGMCPSGAPCGPNNQCPCANESDAQLCWNQNAQCGVITATDNCGTTRVGVNCGGCFNGGMCGETAPNLCGCVPESNEDFCADQSAQCGPVTGTDNCGTPRTVPSCGSCGECVNGGACTSNQCTCSPETDAQLCAAAHAECGTISSGGGAMINCGTCPGGMMCGPNNQCPCQPESDSQLCESKNAQCGTLTALDNCRMQRTVQCAVCPPGVMCGVSQPNVCGCVSESDEALCDSANAQCGSLTATDNCGASRTIDCGVCQNGGSCGDPKPNTCPCIPESPQSLCERSAAYCGSLTAPNNCGTPTTVNDCGTCPDGVPCGEAWPNWCGSCVPETDSELCIQAGAVCGTLTVTDNCGNTRNPECGGCPGNGTCTANMCPCVPESDFQFCFNAGAWCGTVTGIDNCANPRTVQDCGTCWPGTTCGAPTPNRCG